MKPNPQQFSFPPLHDESQIMPQGFFGATLGLLVYIFLAIACRTAFEFTRHGTLEVLMRGPLLVMFVGGYFFIVGIFNHWVFLLIDDLTGKVIDLRVMSAVAPCSLVYSTVCLLYTSPSPRD